MISVARLRSEDIAGDLLNLADFINGPYILQGITVTIMVIEIRGYKSARVINMEGIDTEDMFTFKMVQDKIIRKRDVIGIGTGPAWFLTDAFFPFVLAQGGIALLAGLVYPMLWHNICSAFKYIPEQFYFSWCSHDKPAFLLLLLLSKRPHLHQRSRRLLLYACPALA